MPLQRPAVEPALTGRALAERAERIDTDNWLDSFASVPPPLAEALGLAAFRQGALAMVRSRVPFSHFNMVLTLGCPAAVDDAAFEAIERFYAGGAARHWVLVNDFSQPADLAQRLISRGYVPDGAWQRVVRQAAPHDAAAPDAQGCEIVTRTTAVEWAEFVRATYHLPPPIETWLLGLVDRRGWTHAIRRVAGRVVMARSLYQDESGWAWLGVDAPVPGVMAACFEDDQRVTAHLVAHASARGAHAFVSDIEVPSTSQDSEAYVRWRTLGFVPVYRRELYVKG